jgi:outer membrane protein OmpA-like peptidoglycan-associated protein
MFNKIEEEESNFWISYTDLITGFMIMFIVIAFWLYSQNTEKDAVEGKYKELVTEFRDKFRNTPNIQVNKDGTLRFVTLGNILFENGDTTLTPHFQTLLDGFIPKYLVAVKEVYDRQKTDKVLIKEIRIEGHASSEGGQDYIYNLALSSGRALRVYEYLLNHPTYKNYSSEFKKFILQNTISCGYSYARALNSGGKFKEDSESEDYDKSRRVEFRIILEYNKDSKTN